MKPHNHPLSTRIAKIVLVLFCATTVGTLILGLRGDLTGLRTQLARVPILRPIILERDHVAARAKLATLNYFIPTFDYLADFIQAPGVFNKDRLRGYNGYIDYYERVIVAFPQMAEGYALLGFFYSQEGGTEAAIKLFQKARELNPYVFWFSYDLGILLFQQGRYSEAASVLNQALRIKPDVTLKIIVSSKIYQQILTTENFHYDLAASLRQGYQNCAGLWQLSQQYSQATLENAPPAANTFRLKVF